MQTTTRTARSITADAIELLEIAAHNPQIDAGDREHAANLALAALEQVDAGHLDEAIVRTDGAARALGLI